MRSLLAVTIALFLCSSLRASEPTAPNRIQFDGHEYKLLTSDVQAPNAIYFYTPTLDHGDNWIREVAIGRFTGYRSVLSYALGFAKIRTSNSIREAKVDTGEDTSDTPEQAMVEKYFSEGDDIEYSVTLVKKVPNRDQVVTFSLMAKSKLGSQKALTWGDSQYKKTCDALKSLSENYDQVEKKENASNSSTSAKSNLNGEYKEIDVSAIQQAITTFKSGSEKQKERLRAKIEKQPSRYAPVVFFHLATYLSEQQEEDDALFWLFAGQLRTCFDIERCTDRSVKDSVRVLTKQVPPLLILSQVQDAENSKTILEKVVEWDRSTEYDYDCRWIALHGIRAFQPVAADNSDAPLSIPQDRWEEVAEECRTKFYNEFVELLDNMSEEEIAQVDERIEALQEAR